MENKDLYIKLDEILKSKFNYREETQWNIKYHNNELTKTDIFGYLLIEGTIIFLEETYRHNGTNENKSCYISIGKWKINENSNSSSGRTIEKWKISCKASDKKINKIIEEVMNKYNEVESEVK